MEDFFDKYLIAKNKKKDSFIFESGYNARFDESVVVSEFTSKNDYFNINTIPKGKKWENLSKRIIDLFHNNNPDELFSIKESNYIDIIGLCLITHDYHSLIDINLHWYYNPVNNKLEPTIREPKFYEMPEDYSIDQIWEQFCDSANPFIRDWIIYQGENIAKERITQSSLKSALYIKEYTATDEYKNFISKLNNEFSYDVFNHENKTFLS